MKKMVVLLGLSIFIGIGAPPQLSLAQSITAGQPVMKAIRQLNLTPQQKREMSEGLKPLQVQSKVALQGVREARDKLIQLLKAENLSDELVRSAAHELGKAEEELIAIRAKSILTMRGVLSDEQKVALKKSLESSAAKSRQLASDVKEKRTEQVKVAKAS